MHACQESTLPTNLYSQPRYTFLLVLFKAKKSKRWQKHERYGKGKNIGASWSGKEADFISGFKYTKGFREVILCVSTALFSERGLGISFY